MAESLARQTKLSAVFLLTPYILSSNSDLHLFGVNKMKYQSNSGVDVIDFPRPHKTTGIVPKIERNVQIVVMLQDLSSMNQCQLLI